MSTVEDEAEFYDMEFRRECEACDNTDEFQSHCEGCSCCAECCNCTETDCDCDACVDRRSLND